MRFEAAKIEGAIIPFPELEHIMKGIGMIRGGAWDYERVTYDFKFENRTDGSVYYFRIPGIAVEGEVESNNGKIKLLTPYVGRHYYPHGVEYNEHFPDSVVNKCKEKISQLSEALHQFQA
ncbi:hypothetical protein JOD43_000264 [Pullulanibacillus pueri]|uniref:YugN-like family protein n=1 Tax=Pullulanibacillus pueri TaxID=1437324 RepID=A0A8J2ZSJ4_9BACL|nr:YugN family protein [Pullulanibacillus pueri]MBM7680105.1 hypothetical protein [Pullulanibacillus pueri]GGH74384.1 hypothetical protein GCM10007096_02560 [Pullulanibacillus pueri]